MKLSKNSKTLRVEFTGLTSLQSKFNYSVSFDNLPVDADEGKLPKIRFSHSKNEAGVLLDISGSLTIPQGCRWFSFTFDIDERDLIAGVKVIPKGWDGLITIAIHPDPLLNGHLPPTNYEYKLSYKDNQLNVVPNQIVPTPVGDSPYLVGTPPESQGMFFNFKFLQPLEESYMVWFNTFGGLSTSNTTERDVKMYTHFLPLTDGASAPMSGFFAFGALLRYRLNNSPTWTIVNEPITNDHFVLPKDTTHVCLYTGNVFTKELIDTNINYAKAYGFTDAVRLFGSLRLTTARLHPVVPKRFIPSRMKVEPYYLSNYLVRTL